MEPDTPGHSPQLIQLQMKGDHVGVQSHVHSFITYDAVSRATMMKRPVRSLPGITTEALHVRRPTTQSPEHILEPAPAYRCNVRLRNVRRPPRRRSSQILEDNVVESIPNLASGSISRSSQGVDPGSTRAIGLSVSKACRPNTSGDKSKSITPSESMFIWRDPLASWERRICLACSRYAPIAEPCPRPVIITNAVLCQVKSANVELSAAESQSL